MPTASLRTIQRAATPLALLLTFCILPFLHSCGGGGSGPTGPGNGGVIETSGQIVYSRHRNASAQIAPILGESAGGFDAREVDSPGVAVDGGRPGGDKFMLYYEAESSQRVSTIGLVTSNEEDFATLTIGRTQVVGLGPGHESGATDPTVVVDKRPAEAARRYKMWFEGRNGANSTILFGTSTDGVAWSSFTPCTGLAAAFGQVRIADPTVVLDGDIFRMWFEAISNLTPSSGDGPGSIGYAESSDGVTWVIKDASGSTGASAAAVFGNGSGFDGYSVNAPSVVLDESVTPGGNGRFKMWYEAGDKAGDVQNTIGYATSPDGLQWNRAALPVFVPSSDNKVPLPFDSGDLEHPSAALMSSVAPNVEGHFLLWYTGDQEGGSANRIGLAMGRLGP